jgi:hypothetical protein
MLLASVDEVFPSGGSSGPAAGSVWFTLGPDEEVTYTRQLEVPDGTPAGTYHLNGHVKSHPDEEMDYDRITFEVVD